MALIIFAPLIVLVGVASSSPIYPVPLTYVALSRIPENIYNQVQDTRSGEYAFGYAGGPVAREEAKTSDGVTRGSYSYVDAHGIVQHYRYVANNGGFRVVGTNIPTDVASKPQVQQSLEAASIGAIDAKNLAEKSQQIAWSRKKRSAIYDHVPFETVNALLPAAPPAVVAAASVPTATSSQSRVQIHRSLRAEIHDPIEAIPIESVAALPATPVAVHSVAVAASVPTSTSSQSRYQIHNSLKTEFHEPVQAIPIETIAQVPEAPVVVKSFEAIDATIPVEIAASVPTSTSSQSRYQIHNSLKTEFHEPVQAIPIETIAQVPEAPVVVKSFEAIDATIPVEIAASVPTSTSSQSRYQVHNSLRTEFHEPVQAIPIETIAQVPEAPVVVKSFEAIDATIPVEIAASVPTSTSSQSRYQVHNSLRTEFHEPVQAIPIETIAQVPEAPVVVKSFEAIDATIPVEIAASVPTSTSSQSRYQVHNSLRTEFHEPVQAIPIETIAQVPEALPAIPSALKSIEAIPSSPIVVAASSVPTSTSSQQRFQVHDSSESLNHESTDEISISVETDYADNSGPLVDAIPADTRTIFSIPATTASIAGSVSVPIRRNFQAYNSAELKFDDSPRPSEYELVDYQVDLQPADEFSLPSLAHHQIGVGLGIVPSPFVTYHNYETELSAEA